MLRSVLRCRVAPFPHASQLLVRQSRELFEFFTFLLKSSQFGLARTDQALLFGMFRGQALYLVTTRVQPLTHPSHLRTDPLQQVSRSHRLLFGVTLFHPEPIESRSEFLDFPA